MKHIWILAGIALALAFTSCTENYTDEQMETAIMMNKGGKTETAKVKQDKNEKRGIALCKSAKTEGTASVKDKSAKGPDKNAKNGIMPLMTRSAMPPVIRRPLPDTYEGYIKGDLRK